MQKSKNLMQECKHERIESNMVPEQCSDCGKLIPQGVSVVKFPKEVLEKAKIFGNIFDEIKVKNDALSKLAEILSSDSAFESDCVALDIANNHLVSDREKALAKVVSDCYRIVHPLTSECCKLPPKLT